MPSTPRRYSILKTGIQVYLSTNCMFAESLSKYTNASKDEIKTNDGDDKSFNFNISTSAFLSRYIYPS